MVTIGTSYPGIDIKVDKAPAQVFPLRLIVCGRPCCAFVYFLAII